MSFPLALRARLAWLRGDWLASAFVASALVAACGGGGGGSSPPAVSPAPGTLQLLAGGLGGPGNLDGTGAAARFRLPSTTTSGIARDAADNLYLADQGNHTIRKITPSGVVSTFAGAAGVSGAADGPAADARFNLPMAVAVDALGNVFVSDSGNATVRKITPTGVVSTLAGKAGVRGIDDGPGASARFNYPGGIAVDAGGNLYLTDVGDTTGRVRMVSTQGMVSTLGGAQALFNWPLGIAVDGARTVYVADIADALIYQINPLGQVSTLAGGAPDKGGSPDGVGSKARFTTPGGLALDGSGHLLVADSSDCTVRKVAADGTVTTVIGQHGRCDAGAGHLSVSGWVASMSDGGVAIVEADRLFSGSAQIRRATSSGQLSVLAGALLPVDSVNGQGASALLGERLIGAATDAAGNVYVVDTGKNTVRKIAPDGKVSTLAGSAADPAGYQDGPGATARFDNPVAVATDRHGNVYVSDSGNHTIRKITPAGEVSTLAGSASAMPAHLDGLARDARFLSLLAGGLAVDMADNIWVLDDDTLRMISSNLDVSTAGLTGEKLTLNAPAGLAADGSGNVYVSQGDAIVRIDPAHGELRVLATGLGTPGALAVDAVGNVYLADANAALPLTSSIRKITPTGAVSTVIGTPGAYGVRLGALPGSLGACTGLAFTPAGDLVLNIAGENSVLLAHGF